MDAISFVLGVRSSTLRSSALKDLIYRSGRTNKNKGKGKAQNQDQVDDEERDDDGNNSDDDDQSGADQDDNGGDEQGQVDGERKAWVRAIYIANDDNEWVFQRR